MSRKNRKRKFREWRKRTRHHILAQSRFKHLRHDERNIVIIPAWKHWLFNKLFGATATPEEAAQKLARTFFGTDAWTEGNFIIIQMPAVAMEVSDGDQISAVH